MPPSAQTSEEGRGQPGGTHQPRRGRSGSRQRRQHGRSPRPTPLSGCGIRAAAGRRASAFFANYLAASCVAIRRASVRSHTAWSLRIRVLQGAHAGDIQ